MYRQFSFLIFGIVLIYTIQSASGQVFLTGKVTHHGPNTIPRGAKCEVSLQDVSRADAASIVIASVVLQATAFPVSYQLKYNPSRIQPGFTYTLNARITGADGQLIFYNDVRLRVDFSNLRTSYFEIPVVRSSGGGDFGAGTGVGGGGEKFITGIITATGSNNVHENLQVKVELRDVSLMDVASKLIGSTVFSATSFPIQYKLKYNPSNIQSSGRYSLSVEIKGSNGVVVYTNTFGTSVDFSTSTSPKVNIPVTRTGRNLVTENVCKPLSCSQLISKSCPFGFEKDTNGCPSCDCHDPCNPSGKPVFCGGNRKCTAVRKPNGTFGTNCDTSSSIIGGKSNSNSVCDLPKVPGQCFGLFRRFFYNSLTGNCETFAYGGCRGNKNNFKTKHECELTCKA